ncbi:hypothetical protein RDWZM_008541 [Blomia tropicalis]|uniref:Uncharacterized protein n=1 Tax=Blomia tropicalis TaxID=40697 RepID=A0A9Q0M1V6_BLOTA|nr:hypothetical protein RDWZM_008541 [Blomia tropicalis]
MICSLIITLAFNEMVAAESKNGVNKLLQIGEHLSEQASLRGTTSSQVIEYNPRNIAIMTLLNSMLILGGLLGTMSRPDRSLPFKRVDLSRLKKRILPGRRSKVQTPQPQPSVLGTLPSPPPPPSLSPWPMIESFERRPPIPSMFTNQHHMPNGDHHTNKYRKFIDATFPAEFEISPRIPGDVEHRRQDFVRDSSSSTSETECGHVLQCLDDQDRLHNPSLNELSVTKSAIR